MHSIATELAIISSQLCYRASYALAGFVDSHPNAPVCFATSHSQRFTITIAGIIIVSLAIVVVLFIVLIAIIIVNINIKVRITAIASASTRSTC